MIFLGRRLEASFSCHCLWFNAVGFRVSLIFVGGRLKASFFI